MEKQQQGGGEGGEEEEGEEEGRRRWSSSNSSGLRPSVYCLPTTREAVALADNLMKTIASYCSSETQSSPFTGTGALPLPHAAGCRRIEEAITGSSLETRPKGLFDCTNGRDGDLCLES